MITIPKVLMLALAAFLAVRVAKWWLRETRRTREIDAQLRRWERNRGSNG